MHFVPLLKLNMTCAVDFVTSTSADNQSFTLVGGVSRFNLLKLTSPLQGHQLLPKMVDSRFTEYVDILPDIVYTFPEKIDSVVSKFQSFKVAPPFSKISFGIL